MCQCEDRPCCGHAAEERADDQYWAERAYYGDDEFDAFDDYDNDDEDNDDSRPEDRGFDNWIEE